LVLLLEDDFVLVGGELIRKYPVRVELRREVGAVYFFRLMHLSRLARRLLVEDWRAFEAWRILVPVR